MLALAGSAGEPRPLPPEAGARRPFGKAGSCPAAAAAVIALGLALGIAGTGCDRSDRDAAQPAAGEQPAATARSAPGEPPTHSPEGRPLPPDWSVQHPTLSPNAEIDAHLTALADRGRPPDPADQAGRVWLERVTPVEGPRAPAAGSPPILTAGTRHRFELVFEVGAPGIVEGGRLFVLPDPFWFWSAAQTDDPQAPGYTTAALRTAAGEEKVRLVAGELPGSFSVAGRALAAGEQIAIGYGVGSAGARVDRYAERGSGLRFGLDANADGQRGWLPDPVVFDIAAAAPAELVALGPAEIAPGETFTLNLALVDSVGNRAPWPADARNGGAASDPGVSATTAARFTLTSLPTASLVPTRGLGPRASTALAEAPHRLTLTAPDAEGTLRLRVQGEGPLASFRADPPPIVVRRAGERLVWADLHGHSRYSDGSGTPEDYFRYARDVARLDAIALTDHDHWGIPPLDESPDRQAEIRALANAYHRPGVFVTVHGYEWTSWLHGHRHVLSFGDAITIHSALDPATDRPDELWQALRGQPVLTFAHHSAGEPVATDWNYPPDPELEPVTEIASVHGMSEAADAPAPIGGGIAGYFVRDVLMAGAKLGFIGSGDSHDGHPGLAEIASGQSGLAGLFVGALDREGLRAALRSRRTFATNGIRPWLDVSIDAVGMGGILATDPEADASPDPHAGARDGSGSTGGHILRVRYEATAPIERVELIRSGRLAAVELAALAPSPPPAASDPSAKGPPLLSLALERSIPALGAGEFHYVRITQADGGVAWSSPIFVEAGAKGAAPEPKIEPR